MGIINGTDRHCGSPGILHNSERDAALTGAAPHNPSVGVVHAPATVGTQHPPKALLLPLLHWVRA
jgi:hypothetical protein